MLESATCTMALSLDRTALGADEVRPARWIPAVGSFRCFRFHRSLLPSELLVAVNRIAVNRSPHPTARQGAASARAAAHDGRLLLGRSCSSRPRLVAEQRIEPFGQKGRGPLTEVPDHLRRR